ncbi:MAG: Hsp20/alpha crystallin family protein [Nitrospinae bacterium]|nr:Hsp20/alpha crystallin family protein [Nitrospinota bacterium]
MTNRSGKKEKKTEGAKGGPPVGLRKASPSPRAGGGKLVRESDSATMDVYEHKGFIFVEVDVAGVDPEDIRVMVDRHELRIEGVKAEAALTEGNVVFHCAERSFGRFRRVFELGSAIDSERIEATFKNGVLLLKMPKLQDRRQTVRQIKVRVDG